MQVNENVSRSECYPCQRDQLALLAVLIQVWATNKGIEE